MSQDAPLLWQLALDRLVEIHEDVLHPLDRAKVVWWLRELYAAGERPTAQEMRRYLRTTHPHWRPSDRIVVERWAALLRNPMHEFRLPPSYRYRVWPVNHVEDLIIDHKLEPLAERIRRMMVAAADEFARAANGEDVPRYERAEVEMRAARRAVRWLHRERVGGPLDP